MKKKELKKFRSSWNSSQEWKRWKEKKERKKLEQRAKKKWKTLKGNGATDN